MAILGFMLDGEPPAEWTLFPWCVYFPALTVALSWVLIRWKKSLIVLSLVIATTAACMIINQLRADLLLREVRKAQIEVSIRDLEARAASAPPEERAAWEERPQSLRSILASYDFQTVNGVPFYSRKVTMAIWFAALFPFIPIALFYFSAANQNKAQKSPPEIST